MPKILVIDDDPDVLKITRLFLERAGFAVIVAEGGKQALALAEKERPDLVLCDLIMPGMDGFDVLIAIRGDQNLHRLPVVMFSAIASAPEVNHALSIGADGYVTKPFRSRDLVQEVKKHLQG